jgi:predicted transcriptional regulator
MYKIVEETIKLNEDICNQFRNVEKLQSQKDELERLMILKSEELQGLKANLVETEENQDGLTNRNTALREKFNQIDAHVKEEAERISEDLRNFCKRLGLKVSLDQAPDDLVELKIQFSENGNYHATFVYDSVTEDYDRESLFYSTSAFY